MSEAPTQPDGSANAIIAELKTQVEVLTLENDILASTLDATMGISSDESDRGDVPASDRQQRETPRDGTTEGDSDELETTKPSAMLQPKHRENEQSRPRPSIVPFGSDGMDNYRRRSSVKARIFRRVAEKLSSDNLSTMAKMLRNHDLKPTGAEEENTEGMTTSTSTVTNTKLPVPSVVTRSFGTADDTRTHQASRSFSDGSLKYDNKGDASLRSGRDDNQDASDYPERYVDQHYLTATDHVDKDMQTVTLRRVLTYWIGMVEQTETELQVSKERLNRAKEASAHLRKEVMLLEAYYQKLNEKVESSSETAEDFEAVGKALEAERKLGADVCQENEELQASIVAVAGELQTAKKELRDLSAWEQKNATVKEMADKALAHTGSRLDEFKKNMEGMKEGMEEAVTTQTDKMVAEFVVPTDEHVRARMFDDMENDYGEEVRYIINAAISEHNGIFAKHWSKFKVPGIPVEEWEFNKGDKLPPAMTKLANEPMEVKFS